MLISRRERKYLLTALDYGSGPGEFSNDPFQVGWKQVAIKINKSVPGSKAGRYRTGSSDQHHKHSIIQCTGRTRIPDSGKDNSGVSPRTKNHVTRQELNPFFFKILNPTYWMCFPIYRRKPRD